MKKAEDFKYKAKFSQPVAIAKAIEDTDLGEDGFCIARAALKKSKKEIKKLFPNKTNLDKNFDLIGIYYDAAVVNHFNKWGQGISMDTALKIKDLFIHKPNNVEHEESKIIGHTVNAFFSEHGKDGKFLTDKEVKGRTDRVDISLASVLYPRVDEEFAKIVLRSTQEDDPFYHVVNASWEVAFDQYYIALGSNELEEAEIITDPEEIKYYSQFLKSRKGSGVTPDGVIVNQLIIGDALPVGIGFTSQPAGEVQGVSLRDPIKKKKKTKKRKKALANNKNISQNVNHDVNLDKALINSNMKEETKEAAALLKSIEDIVSKGKSQEEMKASVAEALKEAVVSCNEEYAEDLRKEKEEKEELSKTLADLQEKYDSLKKDFDDSSSKLGEIEAERAEQLAIATVNERVSELDEEYELTDEARANIIADIKDLDEEGFAAYKDKLSVFLAASKKENIALANEKKQKEIDAKVKEEVAKASSPDKSEETKNTQETVESKDEAEEVEVEDVLETAVASDAVVSATTDDKEQDVFEKFAKAFEGENKIQIRT